MYDDFTRDGLCIGLYRAQALAKSLFVPFEDVLPAMHKEYHIHRQGALRTMDAKICQDK